MSTSEQEKETGRIDDAFSRGAVASLQIRPVRIFARLCRRHLLGWWKRRNLSRVRHLLRDARLPQHAFTHLGTVPDGIVLAPSSL